MFKKEGRRTVVHKYAAIMELSNGMRLGLTINADSQAEAWEKLMKHRCIGSARSIELAAVLVYEDEIK